MLKFKEDRRSIGFVIVYFGLTAAFWNLDPEGWWTVAAIACLAWFSWCTAIITHNTIHHPIFHSKALNKAFQVVLTLCYGHPVSTFVAGHNLSHHKYTQEPQDVMRTTKMRFRWNLLNGLFFFLSVAPAIVRGEGQFIRYMKGKGHNWYKQWRIEMAVFVMANLALLALDWKKFLLYFYIPHFFAGWGIVTINLLQHDGCDADSEYNHSRNFVGAFFGWWTFNNGYHTIHHMKPTLHWSLTPAAHNELVKPHIHPNLDEPSVFLYIVRAYLIPGRRKDYLGNPYFPEQKIPDIDWVPKPDQPLQKASLGAVAPE